VVVPPPRRPVREPLPHIMSRQGADVPEFDGSGRGLHRSGTSTWLPWRNLVVDAGRNRLWTGSDAQLAAGQSSGRSEDWPTSTTARWPRPAGPVGPLNDGQRPALRGKGAGAG